MAYQLAGSLRASIAPDRSEPLSDVAVRVYHLAGAGGDAGAMVDGTPLTPEQIRAKEGLWIAQAWTNAAGEFSVDLTDSTVLGRDGGAAPYAGEPLQIDLYCRTPGARDPEQVRLAQFSAGTVTPEWVEVDGVRSAAVDLTVPRGAWARVRTELDAWVVSGRVATRVGQQPLAGIRVAAFDADLLKDDALGSGLTDADGWFRIDFASAAFRDRAGKLDLEGSGPDLYFRIEAADGKVLLAEDRSRARQDDRKDVENLFSAEFLLDV
jgi:hypothetical protein